VAALLDAENVTLGALDRIMQVAQTEGRVTTRRAYNNWAHVVGPKQPKALTRHAFQAVQCFAVSTKKNGADIAMAIDAVEMAIRDSFDVLVVVSSDSDFTPVAMRVRRLGKAVVGVGASIATPQYRNSFDRFVELPADAKHKKRA
jgi:uncharacterized protein (TIGR00288 family)